MSITWGRIEPRVRPDGADGNLGTAIQARVYDPLWLLCRQWQLGEFQGEEAGTPIRAVLKVSAAPLTRFAAPGSDPVDYDAASAPLDLLVEREAQPSPGLQARAEAGQHFLDVVEAAAPGAADLLRPRLLTNYALAAPPAADGEAHRLHALLGPRVPDGVRLAEAVARGELDDVEVVSRIKADWLVWVAREVTPAGTGCWSEDRLEYRFQVAGRLGDEEVVLSAPDYPGGGIDWYHLDRVREPGATLGAPADRNGAPLTTSFTRAVFPTGVAYPGMPADRFWEMEDARVNLPAVTAQPQDLARMLLLEFATVYGNDWWLVPVDLPYGSLARIDALRVTDTFGEEFPIAPARSEGWRMFGMGSSAPGDVPVLALLPVTAGAQASEPVEEVLLMRDELANMGWAVEKAAESPRGRRRPLQPPAPAAGAAGPVLASLLYVLMTRVPENWFPLVPVRQPGTTDRILLRRGRVARFDAAGEELPPPRAQGRFLDASRARVVFPDEEVPRAGLRLQRLWNQARWLDGATFHWQSRRARTGRGEGSSGLQFDDAAPEQG